MSRDIRFRAWNVKKKKWFEGLKDLNLIKNRYISDYFDFADNEENIIFQQFIGLKDETGREIYEGDIINTKPARYKVVFEDGAFRAKYLFGGIIGDYLLDEINDICFIIGNEFENPELLKWS